MSHMLYNNREIENVICDITKTEMVTFVVDTSMKSFMCIQKGT